MNEKLSDGIYILSAGGAEGWTGPDGPVEIVTHHYSGSDSKQWCYWLPDKNGKRPRCGMPLHLMAGALFRSCLHINNLKQP